MALSCLNGLSGLLIERTGTVYDFVLVVYGNHVHIFHRFQDIIYVSTTCLADAIASDLEEFSNLNMADNAINPRMFSIRWFKAFKLINAIFSAISEFERLH